MFLQTFLDSFKFPLIPSDAFRLFDFLYDSCFEFFLIPFSRFFGSFSDYFGCFWMFWVRFWFFSLFLNSFKDTIRNPQGFFSFSSFQIFNILSDPFRSLQNLPNSSRFFQITLDFCRCFEIPLDFLRFSQILRICFKFLQIFSESLRFFPNLPICRRF